MPSESVPGVIPVKHTEAPRKDLHDFTQRALADVRRLDGHDETFYFHGL